MTDQTVPLPSRRGPAAAVSRPVSGQGVGLSALPWPVWIYLFVVVFQITVQLGPLTLTTLRLFMVVMTVPLYVNLLAGRYGRVHATDILFPLFVLWSAVAIQVNNPGRALELVGSTGVEFLGGYAMARAYIRTPEAFEALIRALLLIIIVTLPLAVFEALTGRSLVLELFRSLGIKSVNNVQMDKRLGLERVQLTFAHPIHYGLVSSVVFGLTFVSLKNSMSTSARYAAAAVAGFCVFLSLSSGAQLAVVLQGILIAWATVFAHMRSRWYLLLGITAVAYVTIDLLSNRNPTEVFMSYATFSAHNAYWRSQIFEWGMKNVWANPIFGIGLRDWVRPWYMFSGSMDNFWLLQAVRNGIPGFALLAGGYLLGIAQVMRRDFSNDPRLRQLRFGWVVVFMGMTFSLATVAIWTNMYSFVFFLFGSGFWFISAQSSDVPSPAPAARRGGATPRRAAGLADRVPAVPAPAEPTGPRYTRFPPTAGASRAVPPVES